MIKNRTTLTIFLSIIATLIVIGLVFIYSSSSIYALEKFGSAHYYVKKQLFGLILGLVALTVFLLMPLSLIKKTAPFFFLGALTLTALTLIPGFGTITNGSSRWLNLWGFNFQPSELLKVACLVYLATFLEKKQYQMHSFVHGYLPFLCILGVSALVLLKQPDFGQAVTLTTTGLALFFVAYGNLRHLMLTVLPAFFAGFLLIYFKPYRLQRILIFLNPWKDPQGAGFQIIQSLIAIGSGKFWGVGLTQSKQKFFYLPMQHTDFIFSIIAEETGFFGSSILITLYITFLFFGIRLAWQQRSVFAQLTTLGFVILISLQALINIYVATGLAPTKGIGLPFVSYGSSALLCNLLMLGIIINCTQEESVTV